MRAERCLDHAIWVSVYIVCVLVRVVCVHVLGTFFLCFVLCFVLAENVECFCCFLLLIVFFFALSDFQPSCRGVKQNITQPWNGTVLTKQGAATVIATRVMQYASLQQYILGRCPSLFFD